MPAVAAATLFAAAVSCSSLSGHFAPSLEIEEARYPDAYTGPKSISAREALQAAVHSLERRGVRDVRLCHIHWIVAGVGAAIVHATGHWERDDVAFNAFAVAIYDGTEVQHGLIGGTEHLVMARGVDHSGVQTWYYNDRIFRYSGIAVDPVLELMFELVTPEELAQLPAKCGISAGGARRRDLH